eukprot:356310-Chlamydomonas_euryale.AAC.3
MIWQTLNGVTGLCGSSGGGQTCYMAEVSLKNAENVKNVVPRDVRMPPCTARRLRVRRAACVCAAGCLPAGAMTSSPEHCPSAAAAQRAGGEQPDRPPPRLQAAHAQRGVAQPGVDGWLGSRVKGGGVGIASFVFCWGRSSSGHGCSER